MTVIVVISIFITLCTCTVLMWVRDVVRDFEIQRSLSIQRRRVIVQQQQQQQQQQGRVRLQVRDMILRQLQVGYSLHIHDIVCPTKSELVLPRISLYLCHETIEEIPSG